VRALAAVALLEPHQHWSHLAPPNAELGGNSATSQRTHRCRRPGNDAPTSSSCSVLAPRARPLSRLVSGSQLRLDATSPTVSTTPAHRLCSTQPSSLGRWLPGTSATYPWAERAAALSGYTLTHGYWGDLPACYATAAPTAPAVLPWHTDCPICFEDYTDLFPSSDPHSRAPSGRWACEHSSTGGGGDPTWTGWCAQAAPRVAGTGVRRELGVARNACSFIDVLLRGTFFDTPTPHTTVRNPSITSDTHRHPPTPPVRVPPSASPAVRPRPQRFYGNSCVRGAHEF
jgi:hypothetical protein